MWRRDFRPRGLPMTRSLRGFMLRRTCDSWDSLFGMSGGSHVVDEAATCACNTSERMKLKLRAAWQCYFCRSDHATCVSVSNCGAGQPIKSIARNNTPTWRAKERPSRLAQSTVPWVTAVPQSMAHAYRRSPRSKQDTSAGLTCQCAANSSSNTTDSCINITDSCPMCFSFSRQPIFDRTRLR